MNSNYCYIDILSSLLCDQFSQHINNNKHTTINLITAPSQLHITYNYPKLSTGNHCQSTS